MKVDSRKAEPRENLLVPFELMKRMYAGMVETRLLEVVLAKRRGEKRSPVEGQEACRAAVLLSLEAADLVADATGAASSAWLRGAELAQVYTGQAPGLLPAFEDVLRQVAAAVGAAAAVRQAKLPQVVAVVFHPEMKRSALRQAFEVAAERELPILFVVLPRAEQSPGKSFAEESTRLGVPGIPVEASDAVAICRVAQESILRARAGGGPALLECVRWATGERASDPIAAMAKTLVRARACDRTWINGVAPAFRARLKALKHERTA